MAKLNAEQTKKALALIDRVEANRDENLSNYAKGDEIAPELEIKRIKGESKDSRLREITIGNRNIRAALARGVDLDIEVGSLYMVKAKRTETYKIGDRTYTVPEGVLNYRIYAA